MCNATCADTQTSNAWPTGVALLSFLYCAFMFHTHCTVEFKSYHTLKQKKQTKNFVIMNHYNTTTMT